MVSCLRCDNEGCMERIVRPFDLTKVEEDMLLHPPAIDIPRVVMTAMQLRRRRHAHTLWVIASTVATIMVYITFVHPGSNTVLAQRDLPTIVTDGRIVRLEDKIENLALITNTNTAELKVLTAENIRLAAELEGAEKLIKFGGSAIIALTSLAAWFSRKPK